MRMGSLFCFISLAAVLTVWIYVISVSTLDADASPPHALPADISVALSPQPSTPSTVPEQVIRPPQNDHEKQMQQNEVRSLKLQIETLKSQLSLADAPDNEQLDQAKASLRKSNRELEAAKSQLVEDKEKLSAGEEKLQSLRKELAECEEKQRKLRLSKLSNKAEQDPEPTAPPENDREEPPTPPPTLPKPSSIPIFKPPSADRSTRYPVWRPANKDEGNPHNPAESEGGIGIRSKVIDAQYTIPVLVFTYRRPEMLKRCLERLHKVLPRSGFRVFVSQDGTDNPMIQKTIRTFQQQTNPNLVHMMHHRFDPDTLPQDNPDRNIVNWDAYHAISHHYAWAISEVFASVPNYDRIIIVEEDLELAEDFFPYMAATSPLFDIDPSIYCVSGWNDNGKPELVSDPKQIYRSDFFPGLGWMWSRALWKEMRASWPPGFWDDWLRQPKNRQGRACIRPEVSRTRTWCSADGTSGGQFCNDIDRVILPEVAVPWASVNVTDAAKATYDVWLDGQLARAKKVATPGAIDGLPASVGIVKLKYSSNDEFEALANQFGLMRDFKDGVPRTAYKGVVTFRKKGRWIHLFADHMLYD